MGPGIVILFWLVVFAVLAVLWLGLVVAAFVGWKKKWAWLKWTAGVPAFGMLVVGVVGGGIFAYGMIDSGRPKSVFKTTFGVSPPAGVEDLRSKMFWFADTGSVYLRFRVSEKEFRQLVPSQLTVRTVEQMKRDLPLEGGSSGPEWWTFQVTSGWIYYLRDDSRLQTPGKRGFYSETEYFAYDSASQTAYYRFLGID